MKKSFLNLIQDESGAGVVEYAVLAAVGAAGALVLGVAIDTATEAASTSIVNGTGIALPAGPNFAN